jgi:signal transduction histidine kinase
MSHELRTPLNAIIGFSQVMAGEMLGPITTTRYVGYARDILASAEHLLGIINDILDVSKLEAGKVELIEELIDLPKAIADLIVLVEGKAKTADIRLVARQDGDVPLLRGDLRKVKQIVLNLVTNAIKFSPDGGRVEIVCRASPRDGLSVAVIDTGIGIDQNDIGRVLEAFEQVDSSLSRKQQGTGLGLPLVRAMMELHAGRFELDSTVGAGTKATIVFPADRLVIEATRAEIGIAA